MPSGYVPFVLGSASPRRRDAVLRLGLQPTVIAPAIDETPLKDELPRQFVQRIARAKSEKVLSLLPEDHPRYVVLTADTGVVAGRRLLDKPANRAEAHTHLTTLSGRRHRVYGAIRLALYDVQAQSTIWQRERIVLSTVAFKRLDEADMEFLLAGEEWADKAGGYAIQGRAAAVVRFISGSYDNVVGLSLYDTRQMLLALPSISLADLQGTGPREG